MSRLSSGMVFAQCSDRVAHSASLALLPQLGCSPSIIFCKVSGPSRWFGISVISGAITNHHTNVQNQSLYIAPMLSIGEFLFNP